MLMCDLGARHKFELCRGQCLVSLEFPTCAPTEVKPEAHMGFLDIKKECRAQHSSS